MIKIEENINESEIRSKWFPLNEITYQEQYILQITIPKIEEKDQISIFINHKIVFFGVICIFWRKKISVNFKKAIIIFCKT